MYRGLFLLRSQDSWEADVTLPTPAQNLQPTNNNHHERRTILAIPIHKDMKINWAEQSDVDMPSSSQADKVRKVKASRLRAAVRNKQLAVDDLKMQMFRSNFTYSPPEPNFDSERVMGTICSLIDWYDPEYCTALEIVAGELLYSVVVDSEETSQLLLKSGNLQRSTNFIPLNKVKGEVIHREVVTAVQEIFGGPGNVQRALDLIGFDSMYNEAMKYVFGNTLVCKDLELAMRLAYYPGLYYRVVTQDGDIINPDGTLSGGVEPEGSGLAMTHALKVLLRDLEESKIELKKYTGYPY